MCPSAGWNDRGLIPAHAGKIWPWPRPCRRPGAHPRSRGENFVTRICLVTPLGSSPLTRGKSRASRRPPGRRGLIPAHAGKMVRFGAARGERGAHPRSRGENLGEQTYNAIKAGSSPLTRGKCLATRLAGTSTRLIPAHAGKITGTHSSSDTTRAHPRSRGENSVKSVVAKPINGSSPLTRGKSCQAGLPQYRSGLIPAHAGKILPDLRFYRADRSDLGKP